MESFGEIPLPKPTERSATRPSVRISLAKHKDAPTLARVLLLAFENDKWETVLFPNQVGLTTSELLSRCCPPQARKIRRDLVGHNIYTTASVCTKDDAGNNKETIVGWACWSDPNRSRRRSLWEWPLSEVIYPLHQLLFRPAIASGLPKRIKEMYRSQHNETFGPGSAWDGRKHWYLHVLCVEPRWQGLGIGGALLEWGLDQAKESNTAIYLETSTSGLPVYFSKGFRITSMLPCENNGMIVKIPGMIWEPTLSRTKKL